MESHQVVILLSCRHNYDTNNYTALQWVAVGNVRVTGDLDSIFILGKIILLYDLLSLVTIGLTCWIRGQKTDC